MSNIFTDADDYDYLETRDRISYSSYVTKDSIIKTYKEFLNRYLQTTKTNKSVVVNSSLVELVTDFQTNVVNCSNIDYYDELFEYQCAVDKEQFLYLHEKVFLQINAANFESLLKECNKVCLESYLIFASDSNYYVFCNSGKLYQVFFVCFDDVATLRPCDDSEYNLLSLVEKECEQISTVVGQQYDYDNTATYTDTDDDVEVIQLPLSQTYKNSDMQHNKFVDFKTLNIQVFDKKGNHVIDVEYECEEVDDMAIVKFLNKRYPRFKGKLLVKKQLDGAVIYTYQLL
jgi:hypothetical protein